MQVKIGPSFFKKEFNEYHNWYWAIIREFAQNSIDAPRCGRIDITTELSDGDTLLTVTNDGSPMSTEILINKLLALGESGKNFEGSVGGFGKAKLLLYFCHKSYTIRTGTVQVTGSGGDYEIEENLPHFHGTTSKIFIAGDQLEKLKNQIMIFTSFIQWDGVFSFNGEVLTTNLRKGSQRREFEFGTVYTNKSFKNRLIVRMNGIPMFHEHVGIDRCVILELNGSSSSCLMSNRDGLLGKYRFELSAFVTELSVDKKSALKSVSPSYLRFEGLKLSHRLESKVDVNDLVSPGEGEKLSLAALVTITNDVNKTRIVYNPNSNGSVNVPKVHLNTEFILKNETDLDIPDYYQPGVKFGTYSKKLIRIWGRLLLELHKLFNHEADFTIGFLFSNDTEAQFETHREFGSIYLLNPVSIVSQKYSVSRSLKKRFSLMERNRLIAIALHEFIHGIGFGIHDEQYSNVLTEYFYKVMDNRDRFGWCFK